MTLAQEINEAIKCNDHTMAAMIGARYLMSTKSYLTILFEIDAQTELDGEISKTNQRLRDSIHTSINEYLEIYGV